MKKKIRIIVIVALLIMAAVIGFIHYIPSVPGMFRMNKQLQEDGYYTAEFEFKMLGIVYNLDRGRYLTALSQLFRLNNQLKSREGFIKVPEFKDKNEEMDFYLNLQNPRTGAFMDDSYPFCTYTGPTGNVLHHLENLSQETGRPLILKYPLKYLDRINTEDSLKKYLDDVATVGWIGSLFPQSSFHFTRCLLSMFHEDSTVEKYHLYSFSPEWKRSLLVWFYEHQDPETGLWGPMTKEGKLRKKDTMNTASILKAFIDEEGNDFYKDFPLRYKDQLARSFLEEAFVQVPGDDELDDWHEWNLRTAKTIKTLIKLWAGLSDETRAKAKELAVFFITTKFEKFFVREDGAFSSYPGASHATLDGSQALIGFFKDLGCFSEKKFTRLWGRPEVRCIQQCEVDVSEITEADLQAMVKFPGINSIRIYSSDPAAGNYSVNVLGVFYPRKTSVLDVMELIPCMISWIKRTSQSMGNWTSREDILQSLMDIKMKPAAVFTKELPLAGLNIILKKHGKLVLTGFDELQLPVCRIVFKVKLTQ